MIVLAVRDFDANLLNILRNVPALGFVAASFSALCAIVMAITVIGQPWAEARFTPASYTLAPFGRELASRADAMGRQSIDTGELGFLANVHWFLFGGWWLMVVRAAAACVCAVTIIGLPFAGAHLKLVAAAIAPVGKIVVPSEVR